AMMIVAIIIAGFALHYVETQLVTAAGQNLELAAAEVANKLDHLLFERSGDALMMAVAVRSRLDDPAHLTEYLSILMRAFSPIYLWIGVTDAGGRVIAATDPRTVGMDRSRSEWFVHTRETGKVHVEGDKPYEAVAEEGAVAMAVPIYGGGGNFLGVVMARISLPAVEAQLTETIRAMEIREGLSAKIEYQFLTREGSAVIDSEQRHQGNVNLIKIGVTSALLSDSRLSGHVEEQHFSRHVPIITGYARTQGYGDVKDLQWRVLIRMDRADVLAHVRASLRNLGVAAAVVWVPMFMVLLWATGRLRKEWQQTQAGERKFAELLREAPDAIVSFDTVGRFQYVNPATERLTGYTSQELLGKHFSGYGLLTDESTRQSLREFELTLAGQERLPFEVEIICKDRSVIIGEIHPRLIHEEGRITGMLVTIRDVTERKHAERLFRVQHATTRILADETGLKEAAPGLLQAFCEPLEWDLGMLWFVDRQAKVLRWTESWMSPSAPVAAFEGASRPLTFAQGNGLPGRVWQTGAAAWIADVLHEENFPRVQMAAEAGLHGVCAFPIVLAEEVYGVMEFFSRNIRQPDAHMLELMAVIGNQIGHLIERRQLEDQLLQSQKMEAIGRLAGGIAHDFNNLLTIIQGYSQLVLRRVGPGDSVHEDMKEIRRAVDRAAALTGQLLAFSRRQVVVQQKVLDLNTVLQNLEKMLNRVLGEDVNLSVALHQDEALIRIDPGQIEQVILNLTINARDAMPKGGKLTISTESVDFTELVAWRPVSLSPGAYVKLVISDTGCGMDEYVRSHMFEPFFTTKELGRGTGLGLFTVYGIVKQAGGEIVVDSLPGEGTTFAVYFPRATMPAGDVQETVGPPMLARGGGETLLLVEDEPTIRELAGDALRHQGYTVLEARHGFEALVISAQYSKPIHLLITDVVMPQMSGNEVARQLTEIRRDLKVLYISGYTHDAVIHHGVSDQAAFLQKPFTPDMLIAKVWEALETVKK
ncbi:MAG: PAS domain S-box protein, partial [Nitrospiraceae bacterium]